MCDTLQHLQQKMGGIGVTTGLANAGLSLVPQPYEQDRAVKFNVCGFNSRAELQFSARAFLFGIDIPRSNLAKHLFEDPLVGDISWPRLNDFELFVFYDFKYILPILSD